MASVYLRICAVIITINFRIFSSSKKKSYPLGSHFPSPQQPLIYFLSPWICLLQHLIKMESCNMWPLYLASFIQHVFRVHSYCSMNQFCLFLQLKKYSSLQIYTILCLNVYQLVNSWLLYTSFCVNICIQFLCIYSQEWNF